MQRTSLSVTDLSLLVGNMKVSLGMEYDLLTQPLSARATVSVDC
jgi:hypothetical protein